MELRTISEVSALGSSEFIPYANYITSNSGDFSSREASAILQMTRVRGFECPTPEFVVKYVIGTLIEHFDDITWRIYSTEETPIFSDTGVWMFVWTIAESNTRCIFVDERTKNLLSDILTTLDAGITPDYVSSYAITLLEEDTESMTRYSNLMNDLGLIHTPEEVIPPLSQTLSVDESTARFSSAIWYEEIRKKTIVLAGLGGIGSYVSFLLSRMHPRSMFIFDDDRVEVVNMAGQLYQLSDVGKFKVDAAATAARNYASYASIFAIREKFTESTNAADIMICGFDSMSARKTFFDSWVAHVNSKPEEERKHCLFIDGRLAAEEFQVLCIRGDDSYNIGRYSNDFLFSDEEADETLCSYKQTTYMANMIGSIMVNLFTNFVANEITENLRDLPFLTSYSADSMLFKTEQ